jgi:hypothetical protein
MVPLISLTLTIACTSHHEQVIDQPGYRPPSEEGADSLFRERLGATSITVFPVIIQSDRPTVYDRAFQKEISKFFKTNQLASTAESDVEIDFSMGEGKYQFDIFKNRMGLFAKHIQTNEVTTDYALLVECIFYPGPGGEGVGGIHIYLLNAEGRNAFSFLLNSHHELFRNAGLWRQYGYEGELEKLVEKCSQVVVEAFRQQLEVEEAR